MRLESRTKFDEILGDWHSMLILVLLNFPLNYLNFLVEHDDDVSLHLVFQFFLMEFKMLCHWLSFSPFIFTDVEKNLTNFLFITFLNYFFTSVIIYWQSDSSNKQPWCLWHIFEPLCVFFSYASTEMYLMTYIPS